MPDCASCRHYQAAPALPEPLCHKGVHYGKAVITAVSAKTMRHSGWWGNESCGEEGKHWEPAR